MTDGIRSTVELPSCTIFGDNDNDESLSNVDVTRDHILKLPPTGREFSVKFGIICYIQVI